MKKALPSSAVPGLDTSQGTPNGFRKTEFSVPFWSGQVPHFFGVVALAALSLAAARGVDAFAMKSHTGTSGFDWFLLGLLLPILHQVQVIVCWRAQLNNQSITKAFGKERGEFLYYASFKAFALARNVATVTTSSRTSNVLWQRGSVSYAAAVILMLPPIYVFHSVFKYLGFQRLAGKDHFEPEYCRKQDLVKEGAFKHFNNPIYTLGVLAMWAPGVAMGSLEGLTLGLYQYVAIWVLYFFIEKADIDTIYQDAKQLR